MIGKEAERARRGGEPVLSFEEGKTRPLVNYRLGKTIAKVTGPGGRNRDFFHSSATSKREVHIFHLYVACASDRQNGPHVSQHTRCNANVYPYEPAMQPHLALRQIAGPTPDDFLSGFPTLRLFRLRGASPRPALPPIGSTCSQGDDDMNPGRWQPLPSRRTVVSQRVFLKPHPSGWKGVHAA